MSDINETVALCYTVIQVTLAFLISIIGAVHVRRCINEERKQIELNTAVELNKSEEDVGDRKADDATNKNDKPVDESKQKTFFELWARTIWKMRSVYGGLAVHCFDVLTDVLVIIQWVHQTNIDGDHIDPQLMAYAGIGV
eukprot:72414_1